MNPVLAKILQEKWLPRILAWAASLIAAWIVTLLAQVPTIETILEHLLGTELTPELLYAWSASALLLGAEWLKTKLRIKWIQELAGGLWVDGHARKRTFERILELRRLDASTPVPKPLKELDPADEYLTLVESKPGGTLGEPLAR